MGGKTGKERKTPKEGDPRGRRHLRGKTHSKKVVSTQRERPKKRKDQMGNNPRQESKKLKVKKEWIERKEVVKEERKYGRNRGMH